MPLNNSEADDYLVALKQEFRGMMQDSVYFIKPDVVKKGLNINKLLTCVDCSIFDNMSYSIRIE